MKITQKGFSLIELMAVVAIIGLLSTIIVSLGGAREKGKDSAIVQELSFIQKRSEIVFSDTSDYDQVCGANGEAVDSFIYKSFVSLAGHAKEGQIVCTKPSSGQANNWAIAVKMHNYEGFWCSDSSGYSGKIDSVLASDDLSCQ